MSERSTAASAPRQFGDEPGVFLIPTEQLPSGFAERVDHPPQPPVPPRPASTVLVMRDAPGGPEALLLRRPRRSSFAADAWVFPGGAVDAADADPALADLLCGPAPSAWAERLGVADPHQAVGYAVAAVREAFEETGIVLAKEIGGPILPFATGERWSEHRRLLLAGEHSLRDIAERQQVCWDVGQLLYIAHWITPEAEPRRFDTRFFLAPLPVGQQCVLTGDELVESQWITPAAAVDGFQQGTLKLLPPTADTLQRCAGFSSLKSLCQAMRDVAVLPILPRMRRHPRGIAIDING